MAECVGTTALCPLEAVRIRMVNEPDYAPNTIAALRRLSEENALYTGLAVGHVSN